MNHITQEKVKYLFDYISSGNLIRRVSINNNAKAGDVVGSKRKGGYKAVRIDYTLFSVHRLIFLWHHGYLPDFVDHKDGDTSNNKIKNLRACSNAQNLWNSKLGKNNTSGVKGVSWYKNYQKWRAQICFKGKRIQVGYFDTIPEAKKALQKEREKYHGEFANHG